MWGANPPVQARSRRAPGATAPHMQLVAGQGSSLPSPATSPPLTGGLKIYGVKPPGGKAYEINLWTLFFIGNRRKHK